MLVRWVGIRHVGAWFQLSLRLCLTFRSYAFFLFPDCLFVTPVEFSLAFNEAAIWHLHWWPDGMLDSCCQATGTPSGVGESWFDFDWPASNISAQTFTWHYGRFTLLGLVLSAVSGYFPHAQLPRYLQINQGRVPEGQGRAGAFKFSRQAQTSTQQIVRTRTKQSGVRDICSISRRVAFYKSNQYLIKTQGHGLNGQWIFFSVGLFIGGDSFAFRESAPEESVLLVEGACRIYAPRLKVATLQKSCLSSPPVLCAVGWLVF